MMRKLLKIVLALFLIATSIDMSFMHAHAASSSFVFEEITSEEEIIPGMRYIITAEYTAQKTDDGGKTFYEHDFVQALTTSTSPYGTYGYRSGTEVTKNSDGTITVNASSNILMARLKVSDKAKGRYELKVNDKYLTGFCNKANHSLGEHCYLMPISSAQYGTRWWQIRAQDEGGWLVSTENKNSAQLITYRQGESGIIGFTARTVNGVSTVDNIPATETNIHIYREICVHDAENITYIAGVNPTCTNVGLVEHWYCSNCNTYATDATFTTKTTYEQTFIPSDNHNFVDGKCSVCAMPVVSDTFEIFDSYSYSSDLNGMGLLIVGRLNGKYYAMGHETTGFNRNAVEVKMLSNGTIEATNEAEIFKFDYDRETSYYTADGAELVYYDGKMIMMPKGTHVSECDWLTFVLPEGDEEFGSFSTYDYINKKTAGIALVDDGNGPYFTVKLFANSEDAKGINVYTPTCKHANMQQYPYVPATCTQQGREAFEYCPQCHLYFQNGDYSKSVLDGNDYENDERIFTIRATGHNFNDVECTKCSLKVPVYTKITNQAQFDALSEDAYFIFVAQIDGKTYALQMPKNNPYSYDGDGNYIADIFEVDVNENGIADCVENVDYDNNGTPDYLEDLDGDGVVDEWDVYIVEETLVASFFDHMQTHNTVEAIVNADGTLSVKDKDAFEFQLHSLGETKPGFTRGYALLVPNYVVSGRLPYFFRNILGLFERFFGDEPGVGEIQEYGNWDINFDDGEKVLNPWYEEDWPDLYDQYILEEGNTGKVYALCTGFDPSYGEELRIRMITNDTTGQKEFYFITGNLGNDIELDDELPPVPDGCTETILPIYLYGSEAVYGEIHTHEFGEWKPSTTEEAKHEKVCACGEKETETCTWNEGIVTVEPTEETEGEMTYTCTVCGNTKTEAIEKLPHTHKFGEWKPSTTEEAKHEKVCACGEKETETCTWNEGIVTVEPTEETEGEMTYTCTVCGNTKTEAIEKLPHTHKFGEWKPSTTEEDKHEKVCVCGEKETETCTWNEGIVTVEPTEETEGEMTYTCTVCGNTKTEAIEKLPHTHKYGEWQPLATTSDSHYRECACGQKETEKCTWDKGVVTTEPTEDSEGVMTYTCTVCDRTKTEAIEKLPHTHKYGEWQPLATTSDSHYRECACGQKETEICKFIAGKIEEIDDELIQTFTCEVCGREKTEVAGPIAEIVIPDNGIQIEVPANGQNLFDPRTEFVAEIIEVEVSEETSSQIAEMISDTAEILVSYDLSLLLNNVEVQPNGIVHVTLPIPEEYEDYTDFTVIYVDDEGKVTEHKAWVNEDGTITFETDHFSYYSIVAQPKETNNTQTGDNNYIVLSTACMLISGFCVFILNKKRKTNV